MDDNNSSFAKFTDDINDTELNSPTIITVFKLIWFSIRKFFIERPGQIIISAIVLMFLWGTHGNLELLKHIWPEWRGPGVDIGHRPQLIPGIPWDNELISYWGGAILLVVIPIIIIKFGFKQSLSEYGLGLPPKGRRMLALWTFIILIVLCLPAFWSATGDPDMRLQYPIYKPFSSGGAFILYELTYLPFFLVIEFIFRGYLLFGLAGTRDTEINNAEGGIKGLFYFNRYAILISMLSYCAWHLGKPVPEYWGTLVWGFAAGVTAYTIRSIWPIVIAHWLLNVFSDAMIAKPF